MQKKYSVRLTDAERARCCLTVKKLKGSSEKVRRAQSVLKAEAAGPAWTDRPLAEAFSCRPKTGENSRQHFVRAGFEQALERKKRQRPPTEKTLDGAQEAQVIARRLGPPPKGYGTWALRVLARKGIAREIVESVSYETVRQPLKTTACPIEKSRTG
jgi:hypothetical protein